MSGLRVSLLQQPLVWHDPAANRAPLRSAAGTARGCTDLVVLPEVFTTGFSMQVESLGEAMGGPTTVWLTHLAARLDAAITGSVITADAGRYYNRLLWAAALRGIAALRQAAPVPLRCGARALHARARSLEHPVARPAHLSAGVL